jgi:hypothetical protein
LASLDQCASCPPGDYCVDGTRTGEYAHPNRSGQGPPTLPHDVSRSEGDPASILEYLDRHSRWRSVSTCMVAVRMTVDPALLDIAVMMETLFPSLAIPATIAHLAQAPSLVLLAKTTHHSLKIPSTTACSVLQQAPSVMQPTAICVYPERSMALSCLQGPVLCLEERERVSSWRSK